MILFVVTGLIHISTLFKIIVKIGVLLNLRVEELDFEREMLHIRDVKGKKDWFSIV